ncbi:MAG TPA: hypothetical protein VKW76_01450 [Candidatus Binatia bacterium]|nr:hypothetical protein [Candidatus Binatia bacterium]
MASAPALGQPAPPYPPYPQPPPPPPRRVYVPPVVDPNPPPLSPVMRVVYAPFYAAGLVVRYGFYYLFVAPVEVFARTVTYGASGGVEKPEQSPPP